MTYIGLQDRQPITSNRTATQTLSEYSIYVSFNNTVYKKTPSRITQISRANDKP